MRCRFAPVMWPDIALAAGMMRRCGRLQEVVVEVQSPQDYLTVTIQRPDMEGSEPVFRACLSDAFRCPIHESVSWASNPCVVSIRHRLLPGLPPQILSEVSEGTIASSLLHDGFLQGVVHSKSLLQLQLSRPLMIEHPQPPALLQQFRNLTTLTRFEAPDVSAVRNKSLVYGSIWRMLKFLPRLSHLAVINTGSGLDFNHMELWGQLTALTSLELGKPSDTTPAPAKLIHLPAQNPLQFIRSLQQLEVLAVRATGEWPENIPAPGTKRLKRLALCTGPEAKLPWPAWLPDFAPSLTTLELGPVDLAADFFT
jgi:hypothetical protein